MQNLLRRHLLALMLGVTALSYTASAVLIDAPAFAKNGADDGPGHDAGDDHGGSSGGSDDDSNDSDDDNSGSGSDDDDSDDDNSGSGSDDSDDDDNSGSGDDDDSDDDNSSNGTKNKADKASKKTAKDSNPARPTATITLTAASLANVQAGTHVVVDQLGRQLEIRVTMVNGQQVIRAKPHGGDAKRNPGPITTINVVPVSTAGGGNDDGTPDQGPGDN